MNIQWETAVLCQRWPHLTTAFFPAVQNTDGAEILLLLCAALLALSVQLHRRREVRSACSTKAYAQERMGPRGETPEEAICVAVLHPGSMFYLEQKVLQSQKPPGDTTVGILGSGHPLKQGTVDLQHNLVASKVVTAHL